MRGITIAAAVAAVLLLMLPAPTIGAPAATDRASASCGRATVGGATVITYCGPARATFVFGGKSYRISGGACSFDSGYWTLLTGRQTLPRAKPRFVALQAAFVGKPKARAYTGTEFVLSFEVPGAGWSLALGLPHKVTVTAGGRKGTFSGSFVTGAKPGTRPATGSWTC